MQQHTLSVLEQFHYALHHSTGLAHEGLVSAIYTGLLFCVRRLWLLCEPLVIRLWYRQWSYNSQTRDYHRVVGYDHHGEMIDPTGHEQRRGKALAARRERLHGLLCCLAVLVPIALHWGVTGHLLVSSLVLDILAVPLVLSCLVALPFLLGTEYLYQTHFQWLAAPRELFPVPPPPPGPDFSGMPWGDAKPAPLEDVLGAYGGQGYEPETRYPD